MEKRVLDSKSLLEKVRNWSRTQYYLRLVVVVVVGHGVTLQSDCS